jgi:predicted dehydrogenase
MRDLLVAIAQGTELKPDFEDGWRCQQVLDAIELSAHERRWVEVAG